MKQDLDSVFHFNAIIMLRRISPTLIERFLVALDRPLQRHCPLSHRYSGVLYAAVFFARNVESLVVNLENAAPNSL